MAGLKSLAKDTAIYGLSSIVGRFLNYLLVPIYAAAMSAASGGYGVVTEVYAWTALLMVILTYGMETTFFRFVNKETENSERVYSTVLFMVGSWSRTKRATNCATPRKKIRSNFAAAVVGDERIELPQTESESVALPLCKSPLHVC